MKLDLSLGVLALTWATSTASAQAKCPSSIDPSFQKWRPRFFLLSDIANEPDDAQSLIRMLLYSHQFRIEGIVATTSYWLNSSTHPEQMLDIIDAYEEVLPNLRAHAHGYPEATDLRAKVASGLPVYGMEGVGSGKDSDGSRALVRAVDASEEPLWVNVWGGASVLAQALWSVNASRKPEAVGRFVEKVRVYAISDQDNTGVWIRRHWPSLFYIASVHHFNRYALAAWSGMSGEEHYNLGPGAEMETVSKDWIKKNIRSVGPLGAKYPAAEYIHEGDTPALLYLIQNGLSNPQYPEWGSWGGRYGPVNYGDGHFADTTDFWKGTDGVVRASGYATVWRWREAFQADFAARMRWSVTPSFKDAFHAPVAVVNGSCGLETIRASIGPSESVKLDASESYDADEGRDLRYKWWQYLEPSMALSTPELTVPRLEFSSVDGAETTVTLPTREELQKFRRGMANELHVVLEVSNGHLISYRRVLLDINLASNSGQDLKPGGRDEL